MIKDQVVNRATKFHWNDVINEMGFNKWDKQCKF